MYDPDSSLYERITYLKHYESFVPSENKRNSRLDKIFNEIKMKRETDAMDAIEYSDVMEKIIDAILYVRNIWDGRGERDLTYSYLYTLQHHLPIKAIFVLYMIVSNGIGSWRDVRGYVNYIDDPSCPFVKPILGLYNNQLEKDMAAYNGSLEESSNSGPLATKISLAAKWVPREKKGQHYMFDALVQMWCYRDPEYRKIMETSTSQYTRDLAFKKCKKMYRTMVSTLNKVITQAQEQQQQPQEPNTRELCSQEPRERAVEVLNPAFPPVLSKVPLWRIVKWADQNKNIEILNEEWSRRTNITLNRDYYVPLLDVSEPMYENGGKPLYKAIIKACQYAYASHFGPNIIVFASRPEWVSIGNCTLAQIVARLKQVLFVPYVALNDAFNLVKMAADAAGIDERELKVKLISYQYPEKEPMLPYERISF